jgi:Tfp pilus assembly protein PilF
VSGQIDRGIAALDQAIAKMGNEPQPYSQRGRAFLAKGQFDRSIADFDMALKLRPRNSEALTGRAFAWMKKGDYARALADVEEGLSAQESIDGYHVRAQIHALQGNTDRATADLRKALGLKPSNVFDVEAQNNARKLLDELAKRISCGDPSQAGQSDTCL